MEREAADAGGTSFMAVDPERELAKVADAIGVVENAIDKVNEEVERVKEALNKKETYLCMEVPQLHGYLTQIMDEKKQLREKEKQLREKELKLTGMDRKQAGITADGEGLLQLQKIHEALEDIKRGQRTVETVSISDANESKWDVVRAKAHLTVKPFEGDLSVTARSGVIAKYQWDDSNEPLQAERYMPHLQSLIGSQDRSFSLLNGNRHCFLKAGGLADAVGYNFRGRADAVLVLRSARSMPQTGLRVLFEFKKNVTEHNNYQAMVLLLIANWYASSLKPFVILTDLRDKYVFFWMDDHIIYYHEPSSAEYAWGLFDAILGSERSTVEGVVPRDDIDISAAPVKRRRLVLEAPHSQESDIANLADLEGFLSPAEIRASQLAELLQQLHAIPALQSAREDWEAMFA